MEQKHEGGWQLQDWLYCQVLEVKYGRFTEHRIRFFCTSPYKAYAIINSLDWLKLKMEFYGLTVQNNLHWDSRWKCFAGHKFSHITSIGEIENLTPDSVSRGKVRGSPVSSGFKCQKFQVNPSNSCWDILVLTKVVKRPPIKTASLTKIKHLLMLQKHTK